MVDRPMGCSDRSCRLIDLSGSCVPTMGRTELRTDGRHDPAQLHTSKAAAAPTPRGLDRLWTVGRKSIRRDSYSGGGSPITSHSSPLAPLLRASNFASAAASPRSMVRCSSPAIMMRVIISMYEKRQSEFPCTVESGELPWHRGDGQRRVNRVCLFVQLEVILEVLLSYKFIKNKNILKSKNVPKNNIFQNR